MAYGYRPTSQARYRLNRYYSRPWDDGKNSAFELQSSISTGTNEEVQGALIEGYETGDLRGAKVGDGAVRIVAMRLAKDRISGRTKPSTKRTLSAGVLIEEYEQARPNSSGLRWARLNAVYPSA